MSEYQARLVAQKKEMSKDPPVLPLSSGALTFEAKHAEVQKLLKYFHLNGSPEQVLRAKKAGRTSPVVSSESA